MDATTVGVDHYALPVEISISMTLSKLKDYKVKHTEMNIIILYIVGITVNTPT